MYDDDDDDDIIFSKTFRLFTVIYVKQTMFVGCVILQLLCIDNLW
jgi:hypothetical protein